MFDFLQAVLDGILFGTTYSLIGIGFTLVFGVMHKINMSYAAVSIGAAYVGLLAGGLIPGSGAWVVFGFALLFGGVFGYLVYLICFHLIPIRNENATLMSTVGMLLLADELVSHFTTGSPQNYPAMVEMENLRLGELSLRPDLIVVFVVSVISTAMARHALRVSYGAMFSITRYW